MLEPLARYLLQVFFCLKFSLMALNSGVQVHTRVRFPSLQTETRPECLDRAYACVFQAHLLVMALHICLESQLGIFHVA